MRLGVRTSSIYTQYIQRWARTPFASRGRRIGTSYLLKLPDQSLSLRNASRPILLTIIICLKLVFDMIYYYIFLGHCFYTFNHSYLGSVHLFCFVVVNSVCKAVVPLRLFLNCNYLLSVCAMTCLIIFLNCTYYLLSVCRFVLYVVICRTLMKTSTIADEAFPVTN